MSITEGLSITRDLLIIGWEGGGVLTLCYLTKKMNKIIIIAYDFAKHLSVNDVTFL